MLEKLFPRVHHRYTSLPVLGPAVEGFVAFLLKRGYPPDGLRYHMQSTRRVDERLRQRGCRLLAEVTRAGLLGCAPPAGRSQEDVSVSAVVHLWEKYLEVQAAFGQPPSPGPVELLLADYERHLSRVRGLATNTIVSHRQTASEFLFRFEGDGLRQALSKLTAKDIEAFMPIRLAH